jgi:hypothetical protein
LIEKIYKQKRITNSKMPEEKEGFNLSKIYIWIKGVESKLNILRREFDVLKEDSSKKYNKLTK